MSFLHSLSSSTVSLRDTGSGIERSCTFELYFVICMVFQVLASKHAVFVHYMQKQNVFRVHMLICNML